MLVTGGAVSREHCGFGKGDRTAHLVVPVHGNFWSFEKIEIFLPTFVHLACNYSRNKKLIPSYIK